MTSLLLPVEERAIRSLQALYTNLPDNIFSIVAQGIWEERIKVNQAAEEPHYLQLVFRKEGAAEEMPELFPEREIFTLLQSQAVAEALLEAQKHNPEWVLTLGMTDSFCGDITIESMVPLHEVMEAKVGNTARAFNLRYVGVIATKPDYAAKAPLAN